jgi:glutamate---cysteine ligase / carboxylate-amine ligase
LSLVCGRYTGGAPFRPLNAADQSTGPVCTEGYDAGVEHRFTGPSFTLGIEEELMIVDAETLELVSSIEGLLEALADTPLEGEVKPELMESVCEIATTPCENTAEAGSQLRALRRLVQQVASPRGLAIGSAGTHPFAMWEDQRIVSRPRYRDLVAGLQFVARQELIFGIHVHVGIDDPDKAVHVVNGMRVHLPILLALSCNSPFWRADQSGLLSTRTPIFRAFPRVGIPPRYEDFEDYSKRIEFMTTCKVIRDYTYLWYDVRPHPNFGTVEVRVMDSQTRVEHTLALAALVQAMVKELAEHYEAGKSLSRYPYEMLDENKWLAARHGLEAQLVDLPEVDRVHASELARRLMVRLRPHAEELGSGDEFDGLEDLLENGNGATRQIVVYEANHDLREVVGEILAATVPEPVVEREE